MKNSEKPQDLSMKVMLAGLAGAAVLGAHSANKVYEYNQEHPDETSYEEIRDDLLGDTKSAPAEQQPNSASLPAAAIGEHTTTHVVS